MFNDPAGSASARASSTSAVSGARRISRTFSRVTCLRESTSSSSRSLLYLSAFSRRSLFCACSSAAASSLDLLASARSRAASSLMAEDREMSSMARARGEPASLLAMPLASRMRSRGNSMASRISKALLWPTTPYWRAYRGLSPESSKAVAAFSTPSEVMP